MTSRGDASSAPLSVEFLAAIIDAVAHPIFVKDRQFRFVLLNEALTQMVGHPREEMLGRTDYDFFPEEQADFFRKKDEELFATSRQVEIEEEPITDASGGLHILATTKVPLRDESGEVTHLVGIIHDITRLKDAEEKLRLANEELEDRVAERTAELERAQERLLRNERLAVLGQLSGGLAHQIRNPLAAITNAGFLLRRKLQDHPDEDVRKAAEIVLEEASTANQIITDLVAYARIRPPDRRPVTVADLVDRALALVVVPEEIEVVRALPDLPPVAVDGNQVASAISNLVENAVEAMGQGGTLTFRASSADGELALWVEDSGPGVSPDVLERLFEPLVTTKSLGLGLGLTTARSLVENQGATLECERTGAEGSSFRLSLPLAER